MNFRNILDNVNRTVSSTYDNRMEAVLDRIGLEQKRTTLDILLPALGIFGAGLAVGAALGVMFAPKRGEELRSDLRHRLVNLRERVPASYEEAREMASDIGNSDGRHIIAPEI